MSFGKKNRHTKDPLMNQVPDELERAQNNEWLLSMNDTRAPGLISPDIIATCIN